MFINILLIIIGAVLFMVAFWLIEIKEAPLKQFLGLIILSIGLFITMAGMDPLAEIFLNFLFTHF